VRAARRNKIAGDDEITICGSFGRRGLHLFDFAFGIMNYANPTHAGGPESLAEKSAVVRPMPEREYRRELMRQYRSYEWW